MNFKNLLFEVRDSVAYLTLNRPMALNALDRETLSELKALFESLDSPTAPVIRCLVVTGSGPKAFVAGADIKEMSAMTKDDAFEFSNFGQSIFLQLENLPFPTVAAVNGFALGGGLELALSCDFIYAADSAKFGLPEVTLGLLPGFGGTVRLARAIGMPMAKEMIFSGSMISAPEALHMRLVNKIFPAGELLQEVEKLTKTIASRGPLAIRNAKKSIQKSWDLESVQALKTEAQAFAELFESQDVREGTSAFIEKRQAQFKGN